MPWIEMPWIQTWGDLNGLRVRGGEPMSVTLAEPDELLEHVEREAATCKHCPHHIGRTRDLSRSWTNWTDWVHGVTGQRECPNGPA